MADLKKWTEEDRQRNRRLIEDARQRLIEISSNFDINCTIKAYDESFPSIDRYDWIRILREIEGLQQILVFFGHPQPVTCLPFLAESASEWVKKNGVVRG